MEDKQYGWNAFLADLRSAMNRRFLISVFGIVLCFCLDNWETLKVSLHSQSSALCVFYFFFNSYSFGGIFMSYFSCLLAALPFSTRYSYECQGGMNVYALARCGRKNYARVKMIVAGLSGGAVLLLGGLVFSLALASYLPVITRTKLMDYNGMPYYSFLASGTGWKYFAVVLYLSFLSGAIYGCVGMAASAFLPSPYLAICTPMVFSFSLVEFSRLFALPSSIRLDYLLKARGIIWTESLTLILLTIEAFAICWALYRLFLKRVCHRLEEAERC